PQLDDLARQQAEGPMGIARRRRAQARGDDPGLLLAAEQLLDRWRLALEPVERLPEAALHEPLTDVLDGLPPTSERLGDPQVNPVGAVRVRLQQDLGAPDLLAGPLQLLDHGRQLVPFLIRQPHDVLLVHERTSLVPSSSTIP